MRNNFPNNETISEVIHLLGRLVYRIEKVPGVEAKLQTAVEEITAFTGWPVGHVYFWDDTSKRLTPSNIWHLSDKRKYKTFHDLTAKTFLKKGQGLPGRALARQQAYWISDLSKDDNFPRAKTGLDINLRTGIALPVYSRSKVFAILEFYFPETLKKDSYLLSLLEETGAILGNFLDHELAEAEIRRQETINRTTLDTMVDGLVVIDEHEVILNINNAGLEIFGYSKNELIGKKVTRLMFAQDAKNHHKYLSRYLETGKAIIIGGGPREIKGKHKSGAELNLELSLNSYKEKDRVYFVASIRNITKRKQEELEFRKLQNRLRIITENTTDIIHLRDAKGKLLYVSPSAEKVLQYNAGDYIGTLNWQELIHPEDRKIYLPKLNEEVFKKGKSLSAEFRMKRADEKYLWFESNSRPVKNSSGRVDYVVTVVRDITERRESEDSLKQLQQKLRIITENTSDIIHLTDVAGNLLYISPSAEKMLNYNSEEYFGTLKWQRLIHPEDRKIYLPKLKRDVFVKGEPLSTEFRIKTKAGKYIWVESSSRPVLNAEGRVDYVVTVVRDITERHEAEENLKRHEQFLETTMNTMVDGLVAIDQTGNVLSINQAGAAIFGYNEQELIGKNINRVMFPTDKKHHNASLANYVKTGQGKIIGVGPREVSALRKDGSKVMIELAVNSQRDRDGQFIFVGSLRDITARKKAESALFELQEKLELITENTTDIISMRNASGEMVYLSPSFERQLGYEAKRYLGNVSWKEILHPDDRDYFMKNWSHKVFALGETFTVQLRLKTVFGIYLLFESQTRPVKDKDGKVIAAVTVSRNITRQREAEDQLRQAKKMEAVGQLTGGVAHEFKNILTTILGSLRLFETLEMDEDMRECLKQTIKATKTGAALTDQLVKFSRQEQLNPTTFNVKEFLEKITPDLESAAGETLKYSFRSFNEETLLYADQEKLKESLLGLIHNAREGTQDNGGKVRIEVNQNTITDDRIFGHHIPEGSYCVITVSDTGKGMSAEVLEKAMDPFFTTKTVGGGAGLGLSSVYGFMEQSGGYMKIDSSPGLGTSVMLYFPLVEEKTELDIQQEESGLIKNQPGQAVNILLVEDDARQILLSRKALEALSDNVHIAKNKTEALNFIEDQSELSLLICRVAETNSKESNDILEKFLEKFPRSAILVVSENPELADNMIKNDFALGECLSYPYTLSSLIVKADNMLHSLSDKNRLQSKDISDKTHLQK